MKASNNRFTALALLIVLSMVLSACGGTEATPTTPPAAPTDTPAAAAPTNTTADAAETPTESTSATTAPSAGMGDPKEAASKAAGGKQLGGTLNVLGVWAGSELDSFM